MKLKFTHLAAVAAAALAASAPSFASISTDAWNGGGGALQGDGTGELFFVAYDASRAQTFIVDLNLTANNFVNNNASLINTFSVSSSAFQTWVAGSSSANSIVWNMGGISNTPTTFGLFTTHGAPGAGPTLTGGELPLGGELAVGLGNTNAFLDGVNASINPGNSTIGTGNGTWLGGVWGNTVGGLLTFDNSATFSTQMLMSFLSADPADLEAAPAIAQTFAGMWSINSATGTISYVGEVAAVPIPAAIWLLGSSLLGLFGVARRRVA